MHLIKTFQTACLYLSLALWSQAVWAAFAYQPIDPRTCTTIPTGPGPDKLLVLPGSPPQLLISSHDRWHYNRTGDIYLYDPSDDSMRALKRFDEPKDLALRPHGMVLHQQGQQLSLYVISHDHDMFSNFHALVQYRVAPDGLYFVRQLKSPLLSAPNDVAIAPDGTIYVSNERAKGSSLVELIFLQRKANVVVYTPEQGWQIAAGEMAFTNGVLVQGPYLWVTQSLGEGLIRFTRQTDGSLTQREYVTRLSLLDALSSTHKGTLLTSAHPSLISLGLHWQLESTDSPSRIVEIDTKRGTHQVLYENDGSQISAITSVQVIANRLYAGQFFDNFLLSCPLSPSTL